MKLLLISLWLAFIMFEAVRHYIIIELYKRRPDYLSSFIVRSIAALLHAILVVDYVYKLDWSATAAVFLSAAIKLALYYGCTFALAFNLILNFLRAKRWNYLGRNSGFIDTMVTRYGIVAINVYWALLIIGTIFGHVLVYK